MDLFIPDPVEKKKEKYTQSAPVKEKSERKNKSRKVMKAITPSLAYSYLRK